MVIISFILTIFLNDSTIFLLGEIRCWSLLGFKGLDAILARPFISNGEYNILKTNQFPGGVTLVNFFWVRVAAL